MTIAKRTGLKRKNIQRVIEEPKHFVNPLKSNYVLKATYNRALCENQETLRKVDEMSCFMDQKVERVFMASLDISSLFTNIPIDETIDIIINRLFSSSTQFSGFSHAQFRKLLYFAVKNCHFLFNGRLYEQVDGVAMGSPLGPSFANTFLCHHQKVWLDNCPRDFKPLIYRHLLCFAVPITLSLF